MNIQYRRATADDFGNVVELFLKSMNFSIFTAVTDQDALRHMATMFLAKDFQKAGYIMVAEFNQVLCGVLVGTTEKTSHKALLFDAEPWVKTSHDVLMQSVEGRRILSDLEQESDPTMLPKASVLSECDSELVFFSSAAAYRRCGIGSRLITDFEAFLKECGAQKYYLYSDSLCTYQFYDNNGYQRVEQKQNAFNPCVENYTYTKTVI